MGIMTGKAATDLARKATMPGTVLRLRMAGQTQGPGFHLEKLTVFCLVGLVADITLPLGKGFMGHGLGLCQLLMTAETGLRQVFPEQAIMAGSMRSMAAQTFSISNRLVHHPFGKLEFRPLVACVTELGTFFHQQPGIFGNMRIMTIAAFPLRHRGMDGLPRKILPVMTRVAHISGQDDRSSEPGEQAEYSQSDKQTPHQLFLPG